MSETKVSFIADASQYMAETAKMEKQNQKDVEQLKTRMAAVRAAANEEKKLRAEVAQAIEKARTPAEAYEATIRRYTEALMQGMITAEQFNRIREKELQKLHQATTATTEHSTATLKDSAATKEATVAQSAWAGSLTAAAAAAGVLAAAVSSVADAKRQLRKENEADVFSIDEASRSYAVQAGLTTDEERIAARDRILKTGRDNAVKPQEAFAAATQLLGSGIEDPRALDFFLKMRASANEQIGKADPRQLVEGMSQFLGGMGQEKSFANFEDLGQRMRGLFANPESAAVQVGDLADFAKSAPALAMNGVSTEDTLSLLAVLRGGMPSAAEAATGARAISTRMAAAAATKTGEDALGMMGLKPADVDMVGESLTTALERLNTASSKLKEEERNVALVRLFGAENMGAGLLAMQNVDKMKRISASQIDRGAFDAGVLMAQSGVAADMRRADADKAITAASFEDEIARKAVIDKTVEDFRLKKVMSRKGIVGDTITALETGINIPFLGNVGLNRVDDVMGEMNIISPQERLRRAGQETLGTDLPFIRHVLPSSLDQRWTDPTMKAKADAAVNGTDLAPILQEQNKILGKIEANQRPVPAAAPNPQLRGRE